LLLDLAAAAATVIQMASAMKFGRKLNVPSVVQIKHQLLVLWLKDQTAKEAADARASEAKLLTPGSFAASPHIARPLGETT
jgi:hypothetical protein